MSNIDRAYLAALETRITLYTNALLDFGSDVLLETVTLDSGGARTTYTRMDIPRLEDMLDGLRRRHKAVTAEMSGANVQVAAPGYPTCRW